MENKENELDCVNYFYKLFFFNINKIYNYNYGK